MKAVRTRAWDFVFYGSALALWLTAHAAWSSDHIYSSAKSPRLKAVVVNTPVYAPKTLVSSIQGNPLLLEKAFRAPAGK